MKTLIAALLMLIPPSATVQPPTADGLWLGHDVEDANNRVTLLIQNATLIFADNNEVTITPWTAPPAAAFDGRQVIVSKDLSVTRNRRRGKGKREPQNTPKFIRAKFQYSRHRLLMCSAQPGTRTRPGLAPQRNATGSTVRCFQLFRVPIALAPSPPATSSAMCVSKCVQANRMRAEGPEKIEADCKRECGQPAPPSLAACVSECVRANQMRATGPEVIEADCRRQCARSPRVNLRR